MELSWSYAWRTHECENHIATTRKHRAENALYCIYHVVPIGYCHIYMYIYIYKYSFNIYIFICDRALWLYLAEWLLGELRKVASSAKVALKWAPTDLLQ